MVSVCVRACTSLGLDTDKMKKRAERVKSRRRSFDFEKFFFYANDPDSFVFFVL